MNGAQIFLKYALQVEALELVPELRELKSGRMSPHFFNSGLFNTGESITRLSEAYAAVVFDHYCRPTLSNSLVVLYGPPYKGIPLVSVISSVLFRNYDKNIGYAFGRKEAKDHGEGGTIVGAALEGKNVIIIDDVITKGTSVADAINIVRAAGGTPVGCIIAFDRQEKGIVGDLSAVQEVEKNYDIPVYAAATLADLIELLEQGLHPMSAEMLPKILAYQAQYGVQLTLEEIALI